VPGLTCVWCAGFWDIYNNQLHGFYDSQGDKCGWPKPQDHVAPDSSWGAIHHCSACGGTSTCHLNMKSGACHHTCGGESLAKVGEVITNSLSSGDISVLGREVANPTGKYVVQYNEAGGRVDVIADCDRRSVAISYPVPIRLRPKIRSAVREVSVQRSDTY
jgi:hypothetical protein